MSMSRDGKLLAASLFTFGVPVPVAAAAVWPGLVTQRPLLAILLLTVYEAVLIGVALVTRAASRPVHRRADQLADAVDQALGRWVSRYARQYREYVRTAQRFVDAKGLGTVGAHTPELDRIFVDVTLAPRQPHQVPSGVISGVPEEILDRYSIHHFLDRREPCVLALLGVPGSGKTTLLHHVARRAADRDDRRRLRRIPILLLLRDHSARIAADPQLSLPELLRATLPDLRVKEPDGWWESQLHSGRCLLLLDGLDEVARPEHRAAVTDWIERQIAIFPKNDVVVTSRPHGYRTAAIAAAQVLQVRPFTDQQVRQFLHGWYLAAEQHATGFTGPDVTAQAEERTTDLLTRLAERPELYELAVNPLLLTMIALVHKHRSALPDGRADLYQEICEVMLWRRQEAKRLAVSLPGKAKAPVLAHLAYSMMEHRTRDVSAEQAEKIIAPALQRLSPRAAAADFLADVSSNGLLIEREYALYAFTHHTIAEYLAAQHIRATGKVSVLVNAVDDSWWRETTLLYVAEADADPVVRACLDSGSINALALAYDCESITSQLALALRQRLQQIRKEAFRPDADPDRRRLVAGVLATRHLSRLVPGGDRARICPYPITTDLYYLFCCDASVPYPDGTPELETDAPEPVAGVWYADAEAFTRWLNGVVSADDSRARYRLPTSAELDHVASPEAATAGPLSESPTPVWTVRTNGRLSPQLWIPAGRSDPRTVTGASIREAATQHAQALPMLPQLALALAVTRARLFARHHAHALTEDYNRARDPNRTPDPGARRRAEELARTRAADLALARELAHALAQNLSRAPAPDLVRELDRAHHTAYVLDTDPARDLAHASLNICNRANELVEVLDTSLGWVHDLNPECTRVLEHRFSLVDLHSIAVGPALALALGALLDAAGEQPPSHPAIAAAFAQHLVDQAAVPDEYRATLSLDQLGVSLRTACGAFLRFRPAEAGQGFRWEAVLAEKLRAAAQPVFARTSSVTEVPPIMVQLPALVLAAEAARQRWLVTSKACREVAAGISLLTRRAAGEEPLEAIILART